MLNKPRKRFREITAGDNPYRTGHSVRLDCDGVTKISNLKRAGLRQYDIALKGIDIETDGYSCFDLECGLKARCRIVWKLVQPQDF